MLTFDPFVIPRDAIVYTADVEADGLYWSATQVWSLVIRDFWTGELITSVSHGGLGIEEGLKDLNHADWVLFHNGIKYDVPLLKKIFPEWTPKFKLLDTLVMSRAIYPEIKLDDAKRKVPGAYFGSHSLEAWGYRIGYSKSVAGKDDPDFWKQWSAEMQHRCEGDTEITRLLAHKLIDEGWPAEVWGIEHAISELMAQQERNGFYFDVQGAIALYAKLAQERDTVKGQLQEVFPPRWVSDGIFRPAKNNRVAGYMKDVPLTKVHLETFNPDSRQQVAARLKRLYDWEPTVFTDGGQPKVDDEILAELEWPEAKLMARYYMLDKRIKQIAEGDQAWLKLVHPDGFIHGEINPNGAVTGRATHSHPNVSQVPAKGVEYGEECRSLWTVPEGWVLVGTDKRKLEFVMLAHYLGRYDGGAYKDVLVKTGDIHTKHQQAAGLATRDEAKTWGYSFLYGSGDAALGRKAPPSPEEISLYQTRLTKEWNRVKKFLKRINKDPNYSPSKLEIAYVIRGGLLRKRFKKGIVGLGKLQKALEDCLDRGYLLGLDGRKLFVRKKHAVLNTLLQGAGALVCKRWLLLIDQMLRDRGLTHGWAGDYAFCAWSHDEAQIATRPEHVRLVRKVCRVASRLAGRYYGLRCPTSSDVKVGKTWAETH